MNSGLHKPGSLIGRLILSLAVIIVPVFVLSPCCCVRAAISERKADGSKESCCQARGDKSQRRDCCSRSSQTPTKKKSCCDLTTSACECCQPEARLTAAITPAFKTQLGMTGAAGLSAEFLSLVEESESPDRRTIPVTTHDGPKNRTQALLCVWRN